MERSAIRDLLLAAGVGLLLGANIAWHSRAAASRPPARRVAP